MRDETCLRRQWALLRALSTRHLGLTLRQMAHEQGVTERTIRRDLDVFRAVGFPLEEAVGESGRKVWRIRGARDQPPLAFTFDEAVALYLGRQRLEPLAGTPFRDAARGAFQKVRGVLGAAALAYLDQFAGTFYQTGLHAGAYAEKGELLDDLRTAVEDGLVARLLYRSERESAPSGREVHPYGWLEHRGALYLVAGAPGEDKIKHYKLDRIEAVEVGTATFRRPDDFDLATHMAPAFGAYRGDGGPTEVKVRFTPAAARYVRESGRHESQRLSPQPDGGVVAEYRVSGTEEIKRWILGFGSKALVLEPEHLRREIIEELRALVAAYAEPGATVGRPSPGDVAPSTPTGGLTHPGRPGRRACRTPSPRS